VFRIFDALNDTRNLETAFDAVKRAGGHVQGCICYTTSPVHTVDSYGKLTDRLVEMGSDSICIKDMAGLLSPHMARAIVGRIKKDHPDMPVQMHCHATSGMAEMSYLLGIESGADVIDCAISSMAGGTSHPSTETLVATLSEDESHSTGLDLEPLAEISAYFRGVRRKYWRFESGLLGVESGVLLHQVPGGMISNLVGQMRDQGQEGRLPEVLKENAAVRADLGYPPLVTPSSQIVGTQAVLNVLTGNRYGTITKETQNLARGMYGQTPAPISDEMLKTILKDEKPIGHRPADDIEPELERAKVEAGELAGTREDVLSYVMFPAPAKEFFEWREGGGGPERELVAAVAGALFVKDEPPATGAPTNGAGRAGQTSQWRSFGRLRQMR
ncbi:MAG: pyruvate carboxylase subunit B, partial [Dehalococcoidia bacterium]